LSESELADRLRSRDLAHGVATFLHPKLQELAKSETSDELHAAHDKFLQNGTAFEFKFADLSVFFGGLEAQIGPPEAHVASAMEREHTTAADSRDEFTTGNYGVTTTPQIEWGFVAEPERAVTWPAEAKLDRAPERRRKPMPMKELEAVLAQKNTRLRSLNEPELLREEGFGARLYTGPMCAFCTFNNHWQRLCPPLWLALPPCAPSHAGMSSTTMCFAGSVTRSPAARATRT